MERCYMNMEKITGTSVLKALISFLLILFFYTAITDAQSIFEDKQKEVAVKNQIAAFSTWDYSYIKDKPSKTGIKTSHVKYNELGNVLESITYKLQDTLAYETYKYDKQGKRTNYTRKKGVVIAYQKTTQYSENGKVVKESGFDGTYNFQNQYEYFDDGKLKQITYTADKKTTEKRVFEHTGEITMISVYNPSGVITSYLSLKHNNKGNVIEEIVFDTQKKPLEKKLFVYNSDNKVVSEVKYRGDKFYYKLTYLYNSKGDLSNVDEESPEEGRYSKKQFAYDQTDNLITMKWRRNSKEDFSERKYEYDNKDICTLYETYYPATKFRVLTKLTYEYF